MDMRLRKILRDFINWQRHKDILKEPLTIDYELAESYLESTNKQLSLYGVVSSLPTKEEMHLELSNRVEDIKATSSMGANKQMLLAYRIGFEECDDYMRKR